VNGDGLKRTRRAGTLGLDGYGAAVGVVEQAQGGPADQAVIRLEGRQALAAYGVLDASTELGCHSDLEQAWGYALTVAGDDKRKAMELLDELRSAGASAPRRCSSINGSPQRSEALAPPCSSRLNRCQLGGLGLTRM
jgi:hypothetical protein